MNVGDIVVCVNPVGRLIRGAQYKIVNIGNAVFYVDLGEGVYSPFKKERFAEAVKAAAKPAVKPEPLPPPNIDALVLEARNALQHHTHHRVSHLCSFAIILPTKVVKKFDSPCHAALAYPEGKPQAVVYGLSCDHNQVPEVRREMYEKYASYILKDSPWSIAFVDKDFQAGLKNEILMDTSHDIDIVAGACIALRGAWEYHKQSLDCFDYLVSNGISGHAAYLLSMFLVLDGKRWVWVSCSSSHRALHYTMRFTDLIRFFVKGYGKCAEDKPYKDSNTSYLVFDRIAENGGEVPRKETTDAILSSALKSEKKGTGWDVTTVISDQAVLDLARFVEEEMEKVK